MIRDSIRHLSTVAKELFMGILIFGTVFWLVFIWFVPDRWEFTSGLALGVVFSLILAFHMNYSVEQCLMRAEADAKGYMQRMSVFRTGMILLLFGISYLLKLGNPAAIFAGLFTLKLGAYFQPFLHRLIQKKRTKREVIMCY